MFKLEAEVVEAGFGTFNNAEGKVIEFSNAVLKTSEGLHQVSCNKTLDLRPYQGKGEIILICKLYGSVKNPSKVMVETVEE